FIGNSDALYHNVEHTMLVTLAGHDIFKGRALLKPSTLSAHSGSYRLPQCYLERALVDRGSLQQCISCRARVTSFRAAAVAEALIGCEITAPLAAVQGRPAVRARGDDAGFEVNPTTVQRIARPFGGAEDASVAASANQPGRGRAAGS